MASEVATNLRKVYGIKRIASWKLWVLSLMLVMLEYFVYMETYGKPGSFLWGQLDIGVIAALKGIPLGIGVFLSGLFIGIVFFLDLVTCVYIVKVAMWIFRLIANFIIWMTRQHWYIDIVVFAVIIVTLYLIVLLMGKYP